jgi:NAD(P)-binding Rossmann-like domain
MGLTIYYDYIVVGGGPCGLATAQLLSRTSKRILLLEASDSFGGCHRVARVNGGYFTEHAPRIYSTTYKNFDTLLKDMGTSFSELFTRYKFGISTIGAKSIKDMHFFELVTFTKAFLRIALVQTNYGVDTSMKDFMICHNFSNETKAYIDRVCRVVDGATSEKFSLNEFMQIANQQALYPLYQPKEANDLGFIRIWINFLVEHGVTMYSNCGLTSINTTQNTISTNTGDTFAYGKLILALNPYNIYKLDQSNIFPNITKDYATRTRYIDYISMCFLWDSKLDLPDVHGFSASEWGVVFVVLSDYFEDIEDQTLVSIAITISDIPSSVTGQTANETSDLDEIQQETFRQFTTSFAGIAILYPDHVNMYPGVTYTDGKWESVSGSFFNSFENANTFIPFQSCVYPDIYTVGCHNGYQSYKFTSVEATVTNAIVLCKQLEPDFVHDLRLKTGVTISNVLFCLFNLIIVVILVAIFVYYYKVHM